MSNVHHDIEKSDRAILRRIADAAQTLAREQAQLADVTSSSDLAYRAQKVATQATVLETLREVALATGCAARAGDLIVEAFAGNDENLYS